MARKAKVIRLELSKDYAKYLYLFLCYASVDQKAMFLDSFPELTPSQTKNYHHTKVNAMNCTAYKMMARAGSVCAELRGHFNRSGIEFLREALSEYGFNFSIRKKARSRIERNRIRHVI